MADELQDKTEEATPRKLEEARKKGQVAKSQDLTASIVLLSGMLTLFFSGSLFSKRLFSMARGVFLNLSEPFDSLSSVSFWFQQGLSYLVLMMLPLFFGLFVMAFVVNVYQVKLVFSAHPLIPKWNNVNIFNPQRYKKFFELGAIMKLLFGLMKLFSVGVICYLMIYSLLSDISKLVEANPREIVQFIAWNSFLMGVLVSLFLLALGMADFAYQKWKFAKDQKMTKQEVKEERKQSEGDVHVKGRMRSMMHSFAQSRMKSNVPQSDVIIANPVHFAIAIKYDQEKLPAPVCMAKGARKMALLIKDLAKESKVPIVENPPLARSLYKAVEVGELIPPEFYQAIAEVLAYVYRLNEKMGREQDSSLVEQK